jgi:hypothetical protein
MRWGWAVRLVLATAAGVLAYVLLNSLRSSGSYDGAPDGGSGTATASGASVAGRWHPRLDRLGDRAPACQVPFSTACASLMSDLETDLPLLSNDIASAGTDTSYSATLAGLKRLEDAISSYELTGCARQPGQGPLPSPSTCDAAAATAMAELVPLPTELDLDEAKAGGQ